MKQLLIMRHAKSDWSNSAQSDFERPLNKRGRKTAPVMGQLLKKKNLVPDLIVSSSALRAGQTALSVAVACGLGDDKIIETRELYDGYFAEVSDVLRKTDNNVERLMIVGHNPTWVNLTAHLSGTYTDMKTAEICVLEFPGDDWAQIVKDSCKLVSKLSAQKNN